MSNKRTTMRKLREMLRLRLQAGLSIRAISLSTRLSVGGIQKLLSRAEALGLTWPLPDDLDDARLAELFYPGADPSPSPRREVPDWAAVHEELRRPHVTKRLVWEEYTQRYPSRCYSYSQFCDRYRHWLGRQQRTMRQTHKAGEKCFVDYGGDTVSVIDAATGEAQPAQLFIAVLGASDYTFVEATWTQALPDWLGSHTRAMTYFGGVPAAIVPDNLRSGVSRACRYDPDINPSYQQWAEHYQTAILPARPYKPRDKAKAEQGVLLAQRWILARLRHHRCFSLDELNRHIATLLTDLNHRPFKRRPGCRQSAFEALDKPAMKPLPPHPYEYVHIKPATVHVDYHVQYRQHYYSVPHQYVGERVEVHASNTLIELYFRQRCQCQCKTPHLCQSKIPQFVDGGKSLRLAECRTTEDPFRLVSIDGGCRGDYLGETVYASRTACTRRVHQRHCPPDGTGPEDGQTSPGRGDRTAGIRTESAARLTAGPLQGVPASPDCRVSGVIRLPAVAGDYGAGLWRRV